MVKPSFVEVHASCFQSGLSDDGRSLLKDGKVVGHKVVFSEATYNI